MSNWISEVVRHHNKWVKIVYTFGEDFYAEDIVQEMYLKLMKYKQAEDIIKNGKVNDAYVWFVLRSVFMDYIKTKNKIQKVTLSENYQIAYNTTDPLQHLAESVINIRIENEINTWEWYDAHIFRLYCESGLSMRELAKETRISVSSIFNTLKACKYKLRLNVGEDFEDYLNNDFELI